jgi:hypothetical protein
LRRELLPLRTPTVAYRSGSLKRVRVRALDGTRGSLSACARAWLGVLGKMVDHVALLVDAMDEREHVLGRSARLAKRHGS